MPPLNIFGLVGVRVPILFGNDLPWSAYSNGFVKFGCPEPSKKCLTFETFVVREAFDPFCKGPPNDIFVIPTNFIFFPAKQDNFSG